MAFRHIPLSNLGYRAPEILRKQEYGVKADYFSFGVLLWVCLTGGVSKYPDPQPPSNAKALQAPGSHDLLVNDFKLLEDLVNDESGAVAPSITGDAKNLVLALIKEDASLRPDMTGIRKHPYMKALNLPSKAAENSTVASWIAKTHKEALAKC